MASPPPTRPQIDVKQELAMVKKAMEEEAVLRGSGEGRPKLMMGNYIERDCNKFDKKFLDALCTVEHYSVVPGLQKLLLENIPPFQQLKALFIIALADGDIDKGSRAKRTAVIKRRLHWIDDANTMLEHCRRHYATCSADGKTLCKIGGWINLEWEALFGDLDNIENGNFQEEEEVNEREENEAKENDNESEDESEDEDAEGDEDSGEANDEADDENENKYANTYEILETGTVSMSIEPQEEESTSGDISSESTISEEE